MSDNQVLPDPESPTLQAAAEALRQEQAAPGSQDPEYVRWAAEKFEQLKSQTPAPVQTESSPPAATSDRDETVLQVQQTPGQTIQPTNRPNDGQGAPQ